MSNIDELLRIFFFMYKSNWLRHLIHLDYAYKIKILNGKSASCTVHIHYLDELSCFTMACDAPSWYFHIGNSIMTPQLGS